MRNLLTTAVAAFLLTAWVAVNGDEVKYYRWTDENGVTHISDRPPPGDDYETRSVNYEAGASTPAPGASKDDPDEKDDSDEDEREYSESETRRESSTGRNTTRESTSGIGRATIINQTPGAGPIEGVPSIPGAAISTGVQGGP